MNKTSMQRQYITWFRWYGLSHPRMKIAYKPMAYTLVGFVAVILATEILRPISANTIFRQGLLLASILGMGFAYYYGFIHIAQREYGKSRDSLTRLQRNLVKRDLRALRIITYSFLGFLFVVSTAVMTISFNH